MLAPVFHQFFWPGRIIEQMEKASAAGWQKPWIQAGQNTLQPVYAATKREYRSMNVLMLWAAAEITGYQDGRWASFKQWQQIGAQVRWDETVTPVVFCMELPRRGAGATGGAISGQFEGAAAEATLSGTYLLAKSSYVFHAAQVEGDTPPERAEPPGLAVRLERRLITELAELLTPDAAIDLPVAPEQRGSRTPQDPSC